MKPLLVGSITAFSLAVVVAIAASVTHFKYTKEIPMNADYYMKPYDDNPGMKPCDATDPFDDQMRKHILLEVLSTAGLFLSITLALIGIICIYHNFHDKKPLAIPTGTPNAAPSTNPVNTVTTAAQAST